MLVTVLVVLVGFLAVGAVWLVTAPFDAGRYAAGWTFRRIAVAQVALTRYWRFHVGGVRVVDPRRPYVAVANHESYADIFLISHLPWEMKWLAKDTIFKIPVMGWMMSMAGDIPLVRGNRDSALAAINACRDRLRKRVSVMIFPEGTRSKTGELQPFKDGAFELAIEHGAPIIPIAVHGTGNALPKHGVVLREHVKGHVEVLPPLRPEDFDDVSGLRDAARDRIADALRRQTEASGA